jgi:SMC interacting uncharacterized protein involved in chromosome segregation
LSSAVTEEELAALRTEIGDTQTRGMKRELRRQLRAKEKLAKSTDKIKDLHNSEIERQEAQIKTLQAEVAYLQTEMAVVRHQEEQLQAANLEREERAKQLQDERVQVSTDRDSRMIAAQAQYDASEVARENALEEFLQNPTLPLNEEEGRGASELSKEVGLEA